MLNALEMNLKTFTRKENLILADKNQTLTKIEPPCFVMFRSILVSVWSLSTDMGFCFRVKVWRFIFKAFSIRFVYACSLHVPFMFPCPVYLYIDFNWFFANIRENIFVDPFFDPIQRKSMFKDPVSVSLKWPILILFSSIRKTAYQPLIWTKIRKNGFQSSKSQNF